MTTIEWTDETWNPTTGCDRVSPGCDHCYALTLAKRLKAMGQAKYQTDGDPRTSGPGFGLALHPDALGIPLRWREPRRIFVNSMSDLFHARVPRQFIARVWDVMGRTPRHTYQVLTKRSLRLRRVADKLDWPDNVWMGVSVEGADVLNRVDHLREVPAAVRFLSCEPLLGSIDLTPWLWEDCTSECVSADHMRYGHRTPTDRLHWVITGGESGPGFRPADPDWFRRIRDQCLETGVAYLHKQNGGIRPKANGRLLDGRTWDQYPTVGG